MAGTVRAPRLLGIEPFDGARCLLRHYRGWQLGSPFGGVLTVMPYVQSMWLYKPTDYSIQCMICWWQPLRSLYVCQSHVRVPGPTTHSTLALDCCMYHLGITAVHIPASHYHLSDCTFLPKDLSNWQCRLRHSHPQGTLHGSYLLS